MVGTDMGKDIVEHEARKEEMEYDGHDRCIEQPDAPLGILLVDVSEIDHHEVNHGKNSFAIKLETAAQCLAIVVGRSCMEHVLDKRGVKPCPSGDYQREHN